MDISEFREDLDDSVIRSVTQDGDSVVIELTLWNELLATMTFKGCVAWEKPKSDRIDYIYAERNPATGTSTCGLALDGSSDSLTLYKLTNNDDEVLGEFLAQDIEFTSEN